MHEPSWAWAKNHVHKSVTGQQVERSWTGIITRTCACACIIVLLFTQVVPLDIWPGSSEMPRLSMETRRWFLTLRERCLSVAEEEIFVSRVALYKLWKKYRDTDRIAGTWKPKRVKKLGEEQLVAIDEALAKNDKLTVRQSLGIIETRWPGLEVSISTVKRARKNLGWIATRPKYYQLVREVNRQKRLARSRQMLEDEACVIGCEVQLPHEIRCTISKVYAIFVNSSLDANFAAVLICVHNVLNNNIHTVKSFGKFVRFFAKFAHQFDTGGQCRTMYFLVQHITPTLICTLKYKLFHIRIQTQMTLFMIHNNAP